MKLTVAALISLLLATAGAGQGQRNRAPNVSITDGPQPSPAAGQPSAEGYGLLFAALNKMSAKIKSKRPEIPDKVLQVDQSVIRDAFPQIRGVFRGRDMRDEDAVEASMSGWELLRVGKKAIPPTEQFSVARFTAFTTDLGKLIVKSNPDKAKVEIDGSQQDDPTVWTKWMTPSTYLVRVSKDPDHVPVEENCQVRKGKQTVFDRELPLKPKPKSRRGRRRR